MKHRWLRLVASVVVCVVVGLGAWQVVALHQEVSSLRSKVLSLQQSGLDTQASGGDLSSRVGGLDARVTGLENEVGTVNSTGLERQIEALVNDVSCLKGAVSEIQNNLTDPNAGPLGAYTTC